MSAPGATPVVPDAELLGDGVWFTIDHASAVGGVRRAAQAAAVRLGLGEDRAAEVGLVVSELATNQTLHAGSGTVLLRVRRTAGHAALEVLAVDAGPGMRDVSAAMRDGVSTRGTLGIGLGTLPRLTTAWDAWSAPGAGTVVAAVFASPGGADAAARALREPTGILRPMTGQTVCGDACAVRYDGGATTVLVADGLGHGPLAALASRAAVRAFEAAPDDGPVGHVRRVHAAISGTRGAAVAVARLEGSTLRHAGLGNIAGALVGTRVRRLMSHPGIAGSHSPTVRETSHPVERGDVVLLHSDGLTDRADLTPYAGVAGHSPLVVAGLLVRDFGTRPDDACALVLPVVGTR
ncbi:ATP-binding protein [Sediminihabitans luteus]|uniref:ATP-binding protein n=1 Tax=Sediminihabitans luteus TaxID=1138585 RepID=UPI001951865E|nr:SpoIIE family protein phosphatase [Sediminihabitans luteus]